MSDDEFWGSTLKQLLNKAKIYNRFKLNEEDKPAYADEVF